MHKKCKNIFFLAISGLTFVSKDYLIEGQLQCENVPVLTIQCHGVGILSLSKKELCIETHEHEKIQLLPPEPPCFHWLLSTRGFDFNVVRNLRQSHTMQVRK